MTTIILTIIGILLAAAAALMVIFYGGDAFNGGNTNAQANEYMNAGENIIAGVTLFKAENGRLPSGFEELKVPGPNGAYIKDLQLSQTSNVHYTFKPIMFPGAPDMVWIWMEGSNNEKICRTLNKINKRAETDGGYANGKQGCRYLSSNGNGSSGYLYYAKF